MRFHTRNFIILGLAATAAVVGYHFLASSTSASTIQQPPAVTVSAPLQRDLEARLQFLGQFAAVDQVEIRAQVGGTLTQIHFKDGDIVHKGDKLFTIDPTPYEIKLSQANAQLESATAKLQLADQELARAKVLKQNDAGSTQDVEQRTADQQATIAAANEARAMIRDAKFDLNHSVITAPFSGRIGTHLVSVGNLISGSRGGAAPTTLLTTIVSLDPIYLNFDMSEADYMAFEHQRESQKDPLANKVNVGLSDEDTFAHEGTLDFIDNAIDRSSGTIHARATIPNKDTSMTPGAFGRVRLALSVAKPSLLVPDAAVAPDQSTHDVLTVGQDNVVASKQVEIGELRGGLRVIKSGLATNDKVIIDNMIAATPGSKVSPVTGKIDFNDTKDQ